MREDARVLKNWRKVNCWAQIIKTHICFTWWWFVLNNWLFFNFLTPAHPHAQSLFLFPIVFGINLIEFFDVSQRWPLREGRDGKCQGGNDKCEFLAKESANLSPILARQWWRHFRLWWPLREGRDGKCEGGNDKCEFLARESANLSPILARQWWRHFRLTTSVSLLPSHSLSLSLTDCTSRTI